MEISYKDTVKSPVRVLSHGGVDRYFSPSELHRIGGAGDNKWKTAYVPVSWDLIILPKGSKTARIHFRVGKDQPEFPVEKIAVRKAKLPEDQMRYEAESRAWVASAQAEKAKTASSPGKDQEPVIPETFKNRPMVPFSRCYYFPIQKNSAPQANEAGAVVNIRMARNEYESGTFGIYANNDLKGVTYSVSELKGPAGKLECEVSLYTAEYALVRQRSRGKTSYTWEAQRLWNQYPVDIQKGKSHLFWITVRTLGEKSRPGMYEGTISIDSQNKKSSEYQPVQLPLKVEVLPVTLLTMEEAGLSMGGCVTGLATESEMATMRAFNHNIINIWFAGVQPGMKRVGDKIELDFYYMDDFMKRARDTGIDSMVWFFGGNPNGYPETVSAERDLYRAFYPDQPRDTFFKKQRTEEQRGKILDEVRPLYTQLLKDIFAHAKKNNWPELVITPFDEPAKWAYRSPKADKNYKTAIGCGPWTRDHFKDACKLMHEAVPGAKVYVSMHRNFRRKVHGYDGRVGEIFIPDVDIVCTNAIDEDYDLGNKTRKAGKIFWQYSGKHGRRYKFGFFFQKWDSVGSLVWAYNWGPRFDITGGYNWLYAWYSPFETVTSPVYTDLREAWDDRRYWATAKKIAKDKNIDIGPLLKKIRSEIPGNGKIGNIIKKDFWGTGLHGTKMDMWRDILAKKIIEMSK